MQGVFLRRYGEATKVDFDLYQPNGSSLKTDAVHAAGDTKIMKDEGDEANTANAFVDEGQGYSLSLTAAEMQAARIRIYVVDQTAPKVWLDTTVVIETYGHASAQRKFSQFTIDLHTWHVAETGDNNQDGHSFANAKRDVQNAVDAAAAGDRIKIWPGNYNESVDASSKSLTFVGTDRNKSKIVYAAGKALILGNDCVVKNLAVEASLISSLGVAIWAQLKSNLVIEDCDIYGAADGIAFSACNDIRISNCRVRGKWDGCNLASVNGFVVDNSIFRTDGTYGTNVDARAVYAHQSIGSFNNCIFYTKRTDTTNKNVGGVYAGDQVAFNNCAFHVEGGADVTGAAYGIKTGSALAAAAVNNCAFSTIAANASTGPYDLYAASGKIVACGCNYDPAKVSGSVKVLDSLLQVDASGKVTLTAASAQSIVDTLMADTGITAGGTYTFEDLCKAIGAFLLGTWRDKSGTGGATQELLDWEDDTTVIVELSASDTSPYKTTSKK